MLFLFVLFLIGINSSHSQIIVNQNLKAHFEENINYIFSTATNNNYILHTNYQNTSQCELDCAYDTDCLGIYENNDNEYYCNSLSNLGYLKLSNDNSHSY